MGKEGHAPFPFLKAGRSGDKLADASREGTSDPGVPCHQLAASLVVEVIPVLIFVAALRHRIETENRPVGHVRVEAVAVVFRHPLAELLELGLHLGTAGGDTLVAGQVGGILLLRRGVFAEFSQAEVAVDRRQHIGTEGAIELLFKAVRLVEVVRQKHEADVGLGRHHRKGEELGRVRRADLLHELGEVGLGFELLLVGEERPLRLFDMEKQMDDMPALAGDDAVGINGGGGGRMGIHGKQVLEGPQSHRKRLHLNKPMKSVASNQKKS